MQKKALEKYGYADKNAFLEEIKLSDQEINQDAKNWGSLMLAAKDSPLKKDIKELYETTQKFLIKNKPFLDNKRAQYKNIPD